MKQALHDSGKVVLYGLYFDTDKDVLDLNRSQLCRKLQKLFESDLSLRVHVVGHTDNQGKAEYNLDLSRRRANNVALNLSSKYGVL